MRIKVTGSLVPLRLVENKVKIKTNGTKEPASGLEWPVTAFHVPNISRVWPSFHLISIFLAVARLSFVFFLRPGLALAVGLHDSYSSCPPAGAVVVQGAPSRLRPRLRFLISGISQSAQSCLGRWKSGRMGIAAWQQWRNTQFFVNKR